VPYGTDLANPDFVALAHAYGADGVVAEAGTDVPGILEEALRRPRAKPFLIDLRIDPSLMFPISRWEHYAPATLSQQRRRQ
jgi:acetolactate synthase-1/2/3 large subunit